MPFVSTSSHRNAYGKQNVFGGSFRTGVDASCSLIVSTSTDFNLDSSFTEFTAECYIYQFDLSGNHYIFERGSGFALYYLYGSSNFIFTLGTQTSLFSSARILNRWQHIAITRDSSSNVRFFQNGIQRGSTSLMGNTAVSTNVFVIGNRSGTVVGSNLTFKGFITNFRFIKGTCLYSSNFTKPLSPLTDITNTKLLLTASTESGFITNTSASAKTITNRRCEWNSNTPFS